MESLPAIIYVVFVATTFLTVYLFFRASGNSKRVLALVSAWLVVQACVSLTGFYTVTDSLPPRFILLIGPPLLFIIFLFVLPSGRKFLDTLDQKFLTLLHTVRIPVEITLYWLFLGKLIPEVMTFEGRNLDILSGISAIVVYYFAYQKKVLHDRGLLIWNFICLGLLINIVTLAVLSAPFPFQQMAFDQPNVGVLYFPFTWLPCCIVPLVLLSHIAQIRRLLFKSSRTQIGEHAVVN